MQADSLKLTSYFGERHRANGGVLADALLELYGRREVATSILLRGIEGFGLRHHLRSDRLLTLSEDLPLVAVAVDRPEKIEALAEEVLALKRTGLVTLERARLLAGQVGPLELRDEPGSATKLTVYVGRQERIEGRPAFVAVCELLHQRGVAGATALLGVDGTAHGVRQRASFFGRNAEVPMMIIAVGDAERLAAVLPELGAMLARPLITLERVTVCKRDGERLSAPRELPESDEHGLAMWQKLMVYSSEQAEHGGRPQHHAIVRALRGHGLRGATVLRGVWGFHGAHPPHGDRLLQLRRHVPVVTIAIDTPPRIAEAYAIIDGLTAERGLVTAEMVPALSALTREQRHGGMRLARWSR